MKYIIFFHFYLINGESKNISTCLIVYQDHISFYAYDVGYIDWKIDEVHQQSFDKKTHNLNAIYLVSYMDIKGIIYVLGIKAHIVIIGDGKHYIIDLKE